MGFTLEPTPPDMRLSGPCHSRDQCVEALAEVDLTAESTDSGGFAEDPDIVWLRCVGQPGVGWTPEQVSAAMSAAESVGWRERAHSADGVIRRYAEVTI